MSMFSVTTPVLENTFVRSILKHVVILCNKAEVFSLSITNPNG